MMHKHEWVAKEKFSGTSRKGKSFWIQGYVCKCGAVDYTNMSTKYQTVNKNENTQ